MQSNGVYKSSFSVQHKASCQPADKENLLQVVKGKEPKTMVRSSLGSLELIVTNLGEVLVGRDMLP